MTQRSRQQHFTPDIQGANGMKTIQLNPNESFMRGDAVKETLAEIRDLKGKIKTGHITDTEWKNNMIHSIIQCSGGKAGIYFLAKDLLETLYLDANGDGSLMDAVAKLK